MEEMNGSIDISLYGNECMDMLAKDYEIEDVNIDYIAKSGSTGLLLLDSEFNDIDVTGKDVISKCKFAVVPTGYNNQDDGNPLCVWLDNCGGKLNYYTTGTMSRVLKDLSYNHRNKPALDNINNLRDIFSTYKDIRGTGLKNIISYNENLIENIVMQGEIETKELVSAKLLKRSQAEASKKSVTEDGVKDTAIDKVQTKTMLGMLADEVLKIVHSCNWTSGKGNLVSYLLGIMRKAGIEIDKRSNNGYVLSNNNKMCCINTGLIDTFCNDIYIADMTVNTRLIHNKELKIVSGKSELLKLGFSLADIRVMPRPIKFSGRRKDLVFDGDINTFDLDNSTFLKHLVLERLDRFPEQYREYPTDRLCSIIKENIASALKMQERDYKYFVPMYNFSHDVIQFLVPIYLGSGIGGKPDIVAVVGYGMGLYRVYTVLKPEVAFDNARLISSIETSWLKCCG